MSPSMKGSVLTLLAASFLGISGVSGQFLLGRGIHVNLLTSLRLLISGLVLLLILGVTEPNKLVGMLRDKATVLSLVVFSLMGLVLNQYMYLQAIHHTNAGTATVLQYMTPVLILAFVCLKTKRFPTKTELAAIVFALGGTVIMATRGQLTSLAVTPIGLPYGLLSAVTYAAYILLPVGLIKRWGSLPVIGLGMLLGGLVFPVATQAWRYDSYLSLETLPAYLGIIDIGTIAAYTLFLKGLSLVGPVKGRLLASIEPVAAIFFALVLLKESFYLIDLLGMALILMAVFLVNWQNLKREAAPASSKG